MEENKIVQDALNGNSKALEMLVLYVKDSIYNLAVRFLWDPPDAEDATQEILIKIITNLSSFKGQSGLRTWCYRIAANYLIDVKKSKTESMTSSFSSFAKDLGTGLSEQSYFGADSGILEEEIKIGCTMGMLLCLSRQLRLAFILGTVFELMGSEASQILEITQASYRKRLSRAKERMQLFMLANCGLINKSNPCRCAKRVDYAVTKGRLNPNHLLFASGTNEYNREMEELHTMAGVFKSHPSYILKPNIIEHIKELIVSRRYKVLR
jgi:RNA polymerase sigma factor (sigma-70 family)